MPILASSADERVRDVRVSEDTLTVDLMDGRTISVPLLWYPRPLSGTPKERTNWKPCAAGYGIHTGRISMRISARRGYCAVRRHPPVRRVARQNAPGGGETRAARE